MEVSSSAASSKAKGKSAKQGIAKRSAEDAAKPVIPKKARTTPQPKAKVVPEARPKLLTLSKGAPVAATAEQSTSDVQPDPSQTPNIEQFYAPDLPGLGQGQKWKERASLLDQEAKAKSQEEPEAKKQVKVAAEASMTKKPVTEAAQGPATKKPATETAKESAGPSSNKVAVEKKAKAPAEAVTTSKDSTAIPGESAPASAEATDLFVSPIMQVRRSHG